MLANYGRKLVLIIYVLLLQGADIFKAKVNVEVQWASEHVIAAIERNGGIITTAFYDTHSLWAVIDPEKFFMKGNFYKFLHFFNHIFISTYF